MTQQRRARQRWWFKPLLDPDFDADWEAGYADIRERIGHAGIIEPLELTFPRSGESWGAFHARNPALSLGLPKSGDYHLSPNRAAARRAWLDASCTRLAVAPDERERRIAQITDQLSARADQSDILRRQREQQEAAARAWWLNHNPALTEHGFLWIATLGDCAIGDLRLGSAYYFLPLPIADRVIRSGSAIATPNYLPPK